jgi:hypothetical protein
MDKNKLRRIIREEIQNLNESNMSGAIYHFTQRVKLLRILTDDYLKMANSIGKPAEVKHQRGRMKYASFTTIRHAGVGYAKQMQKEESDVDVRITFDARKLGSNHKIVPAQYYNTTRQADWTAMKRSLQDENEVRIVSNKNGIKGVSKFITSIDILIRESEVNSVSDGDDYDYIESIHALAKKRGIKIRYFDSESTWNLGRKASDYWYGFFESKNTPAPEPYKIVPEVKPLGWVHCRQYLAAYILLERFAHKNILQRFLDYVKDNSHGTKIYGEEIEFGGLKSFAESEYKKFKKGSLESYKSAIDKGWYIGKAISQGGSDKLGISTVFHSLVWILKDNYFPPVQSALYKIHAYKERYIKERPPKPDEDGIIHDPDRGFNEFVFKVMLGIKDYGQK